jgi:hypothetical protein
LSGLPTGPFLNAEAIYKGLLGIGLSTNAAAGVAGNIYQESHGNPGSPSSAGGGLFGETVANGGSTSGGSLAEQLKALAAYIAKNGSVADVNAHASSPSEAALYFSQRYERPGAPNNPVREQAAQWVAQAAKSGNWGTSAGTSTPSSGGSGGLFSWPTEITGFFSDGTKFVTGLLWILTPSNWVRIGAFFAGTILLMIAVYALISVGEGGPALPKLVPIPV